MEDLDPFHSQNLSPLAEYRRSREGHGAMAQSSTKLKKLEFAVFKNRPNIGGFELGPKHRVLACCSGGADSMALVLALAKLQARWEFVFSVAYVHHGPSIVGKTDRYRDKAGKLVERWAKKRNIKFHHLEISIKKSDSIQAHDSEEAMREGRRRSVEKFASENGIDVIAQGHHYDDLFETRLIRMLRGTGPQGVSAMKILSFTDQRYALWRPFLNARRTEIEAYLGENRFKKSVDWIEDPSNRDARYLRNAIRKSLLPAIEKIRPGGAKAMARSLDLLADFVEIASESSRPTANSKGIDRRELLSLAPKQRRERLANWVLSLGIRGFSRAHTDEMLKRISSPRKRLSFELCGQVWFVSETIRSGSASS